MKMQQFRCSHKRNAERHACFGWDGNEVRFGHPFIIVRYVFPYRA